MSASEIRKFMSLMESRLTEATSDDWLKANGWEETHGIGLWTKADNERWVIDTNAEGVVAVYDEVAGYGEPAKYCATVEVAAAYVEKQDKLSPTGELFGLYRSTAGYHADGNVEELQPDGSWLRNGRKTAQLMTKKEAEAMAAKMNDGNDTGNRVDVFDIRWRS